MNPELVHKQIITNLTRYFQGNSQKHAVIGVSGGIDSAVTLKLAVDALGAENVSALIMPETGMTRTENISHAKMLCDYFDVKYYYQPINTFLLSYMTLPWQQNEIAHFNTKARIRATLLYNFANTFQALVLGTSNKSELLLGYGTKYGDLAADMYVIGDLYKTEVYQLAEFMGLPEEMLKKAPTAELYEGQTDEGELGGTYKEIDIILQQRQLGDEELIAKGMNAMLVRKLFQRIHGNLHKTEMPPILASRDEDEEVIEVQIPDAKAGLEEEAGGRVQGEEAEAGGRDEQGTGGRVQGEETGEQNVDGQMQRAAEHQNTEDQENDIRGRETQSPEDAEGNQAAGTRTPGNATEVEMPPIS